MPDPWRGMSGVEIAAQFRVGGFAIPVGWSRVWHRRCSELRPEGTIAAGLGEAGSVGGRSEACLPILLDA